MNNKRDEDILASAAELRENLNSKTTDLVLKGSDITGNKEVYKKLMPADVTAEMIDKVNNFNTKFIDTVVALTSKVGEDAFKSKKGADEVTGAYQMQGGGVTIVKVARKKSYFNVVKGVKFEAPGIRVIVKSPGIKGTASFHKRLKDSIATAIA